MVSRVGGRATGTLHTVVVEGFDDAGKLIINDPQEGTTYKMLLDDFLEAWNGDAVAGFAK